MISMPEGDALLLGLGLVVAGVTYLILSRLYFHPLSGFPGPTLAALTDFYIAFYDLVRDGETVAHIWKLHEQYGPVVRYGPNRLHFSDPAAYDAIYRSASHTKEAAFYNGFTLKEASFGMVDNRASRERRHRLLPFFSRKSVLKLEHVLQQTIDRFIDALDAIKRTPLSLVPNLHHGFSSISIEVITEYCFAKSLGAIQYPDFGHPIIQAIETGTRGAFVLMNFPIFIPLFSEVLPSWAVKLLAPSSYAIVDFKDNQNREIAAILKDRSILDRADHEIIYHHLLSSDIPEKGAGRARLGKAALEDEAAILIGAGTETVATTLSVVAFHVLSNPEIKRRLKEELLEAWPEVDEPMPLERFEKLPYLTAIINEGLRLSHGVVTPLPRVVLEPTEIAGYRVPANTTVAISHTFVNLNPNVFPNPTKFDPSRWIDSQNTAVLETNLVTFSKGPKSCIGVNLAWAELYLILGNVFRKVDMELIDAREEDMEWKSYFVPAFRGTLKAKIHHVAV